MVVAEILLLPFLSWLAGGPRQVTENPCELEAELSRNLESVSGREEYVRVALKQVDGVWIADPLFGKSGLISTLVEADGLIRVDRNREGLYKGERVRVLAFSMHGERDE
jgi:molybdopterin molybdotransferase